MHISTSSQLKSKPQAQTGPLAAKIKRIAGRYEVVTSLKGGMGIVYLCRDERTGQPVALKTFKPEFLSHRAARDLFLREGTMWVEMGQHPHIVRAYRVERIGDGREVYLVLEWIVQPRGKATPSLRSWLVPGRPLPLKQALLFALHMARGMKYAVGKIPGLVHRDIKPENILIGFDGIARVTDFGLASTLSGMSNLMGNLPQAGDSKRTQLTQGVVGTPLYMAPEQWLHQPLDVRADIYALGCILYEMLTGQFAAKGENKEQLKQAHLTGRIQPPPNTLPRDVLLLLRRCLNPDTNERYRSWAEVERALATVYEVVTGHSPPVETSQAGESRQERIAAGDSYNMMGLSYLDIGKLDVAIMYFEQAVTVARAEDSLALEAAALGNLGLVYASMGYVSRALDFHDEQLAIAREIEDRAEEGRALGHMGRARGRRGDSEPAINYHKQALTIFREIGDKFSQAASLYNLGEAYRLLGDAEKAETLFKQSLGLAREVGDQARVKYILRSMGRIYLDSGNMKEATMLFQQVMILARKLGDRVGEGDAYSDLAELNVRLGERKKALKLFSEALGIAHESNDFRRASSHLIHLGDLYLEAGDVDEAQEYYQEALQAAQELHDHGREIDSLHKVGHIHIIKGDHMQAASLFRRMQELARRTGDKLAEQRALLNLGEAYGCWGDWERKAEYLKEHLTISRQMGSHALEMKTMAELGHLLYQMRHHKEAIPVFTAYLEKARATGNRVAEIKALHMLANATRDSGHTKKSVDRYKAAWNMARKEKRPLAEAAILSDLGVAYNDMGKKRPAGRYAAKGLQVAERVGDETAVAEANFKMAMVLFKQKKHSKARPFAQKAHAFYVEQGDKEQAERMQRVLRMIDQ